MAIHSDPARGAPAERRYGAVSILLHWLIALLIVIQIGLGWYFNNFVPDHSPQQDSLVTLHVSIGLTILLLVLVRIAVRLTHPAPPLPPMPVWELVLARATHGLFYVLMLALPLTGWAIVSTRPGMVHIWGLPWPKLPGLGGIAASRPLRHTLQDVHTDYLVWITLANLALHVMGALWHQFAPPRVLQRMLPVFPARRA